MLCQIWIKCTLKDFYGGWKKAMYRSFDDDGDVVDHDDDNDDISYLVELI